eukprot:9483579-Pyramimonas_sp.AAC.1
MIFQPAVALTARKSFEHQESTDIEAFSRVGGPGRRYSVDTALACWADPVSILLWELEHISGMGSS